MAMEVLMTLLFSSEEGELPPRKFRENATGQSVSVDKARREEVKEMTSQIGFVFLFLSLTGSLTNPTRRKPRWSDFMTEDEINVYEEQLAKAIDLERVFASSLDDEKEPVSLPNEPSAKSLNVSELQTTLLTEGSKSCETQVCYGRMQNTRRERIFQTISQSIVQVSLPSRLDYYIGVGVLIGFMSIQAILLTTLNCKR